MTDDPAGRSSLDKAANEEVPTLRELSLYLGMSGRTLYRYEE
ncbi:DNA-packaging protein [Candidatus Hakubella thermalkaliphila]|nr:DNA-packaging protein [Candidatus Hakubella thermalkaliphila]